ncbi:MAG: LamG domain-containing protein [Verrucomicrobia bacterium]|nr:LamG domain-containing protein [Verrucomicrobiota bacterium]
MKICSYYLMALFFLLPAWGRAEPKLLAYWNFDEIDQRQVKDVSGKGHHGRVYGEPVLEKGIRGQGLRFQSNDDYVDFGSPVIPAGDFTISVWIKCDDVEKQFFLGQYRYQDPNRLDLVIRNGRVLIQIGDKMASEALLKKNRWYHVVYVRKGKVLRIYLDAVLVKTGELATAVLQDAPLIAGRINVPKRDSFRFTGVMDELKIFGGALTEEGVKALRSNY